MADSSFTFDTNISAVVREIVAGLREISRAASAERGRPAGQAILDLEGGVKRDAKAALEELKRFQRESNAVGSGQRSLRPNELPFSGNAEATLNALEKKLVGRVRTLGQKAGPEAADLDLNAVLRDVIGVVRGMRNTARGIAREIERAGTEQQRIAFGSPKDIRGIRNDRLPDLGTPARLQQQAVERAQAAADARAQASEQRRAASRAATIVRQAQREQEADDRRQTRLVSSMDENERRGIESARRQARALLDRAQDVKELAKDGLVGSTGVRRLTRDRLAVEQPDGSTQFLRPDKKTGGFETIPQTDVLAHESARLADEKARSAAGQLLGGQVLENSQRKLAQELDAEAVRLADRNTAAAAGATTRQITPNRFARDNEQGGTDFFQVTSGRARQITNGGQLRDAAKKDEEFQAAASQAVEARAEQERRTAPETLAADEARIAAERRLARELDRLAEDVKRNGREGLLGPATGVRDLGKVRGVGDRVFADQRLGATSFFRVNPETGGAEHLEPGTPERQAAREADLAARRAALAAQEKSSSEAQVTVARRVADVQKEFAAQAEAQSRRGIINNFLAGATNPGFGGGTGFSGNFDGLARSAGQAVKFSTLYQIMGLLTQSVHAAAAEFLDMNDSVTELQVAMQGTSGITAEFTNQLQDFAAVGGFNVGEAMDVAASGIRAFGDEVRRSGGDVDKFGEDFAQQAGRLAVLSKTDLTDAAGNLKAVAAGFSLPLNKVGLTQVTDAVAGAKLTGGGDEKQIFQGLANSALIFKELGFSLNESATIISKINAETDQSGQLIASRVSRLGQIIGGTSGKSFIADLNGQLQPEQRIDTTKSIRDQVLKLSEAYGTLSQAQRQTVNSRLGGTANARELIILLEQLGGPNGIAAKTKGGFAGAGAEEFAHRLDNVRAKLTQIQGNVKAIVTNLAASGLAAPFVGLIDILTPISVALREITQMIFALTDGVARLLGPFQSLLGPVAAVALALKGISLVRGAGGVGAFVREQEARLAPTRALSRSQLAENALNSAKGSALVARRPQLAEIDRTGALADLDKARAEATTNGHDLAVRTRVASAELAVAATGLQEASQRLRGAERELAAAQAQVAREQAAGRVTPGAQRRLTLAEEEANQARIGRNNAIQGVTRSEAQLNLAEKAQSRDDDITSKFESRREGLQDKRLKAEQRLTEKIEKARGTGDTGRAARLEDGLLTQRASFNAQLARIDAEELALRKRALVQLTEGQIIADRATLGLTRSAREGTLGSGARRLGGNILDFAGGPIGISLLGLTAGGSFVNARNSLGDAQSEATKVASQNVGITSQALRDASESNKTAAANLQEAASGFFGNLADFVAGSPAEKQSVDRRQLGDLQAKQADALDKLQQASQLKTGAEALAAGIDTTDAQSIGQSLQQMSAAGHSAADVMDALTLSIQKLQFASTASTDKLTDTERLGISLQVGNDTAAELANRRAAALAVVTAQSSDSQAVRDFTVANFSPDSQDFVKRAAFASQPKGEHGGPGGLITPQQLAAQSLTALDKVDSEQIRRVTEETTRRFLGDTSAGDLNSKTTQDAYKDLLTKNLEQAMVPPEVAAGFARDATIHLSAQVDQLTTKLSDPKQLENFISNVPAVADQVGQEAATASKLQSLRTGTPDNSAQAGTDATRKSLQQNFQIAKAAIEKAESRAKDPLSRETGDLFLNILQTAMDKAEIDSIQNTIARANRDIDLLERQKRKQLSTATSTAQIGSITARFGSAELDKALASNDTDTIVKAIEAVDKATVDAERKAVHAALVKARTDYANLIRLKRHDPEVDLGGAAAALKAAESAAAAFDAADAQAVAGSHGANDTPEQIKGAEAQAWATKIRNSTRMLQANVQVAAANLNVPGQTPKQHAEALKAYYEALNALNDGLQDAKNATDDINNFPESQLQSSASALRNAKQNVNKFAKGTKEWAEAQAALAQAQRASDAAVAESGFLAQDAAGDQTDPVFKAQQARKRAQAKLNRDNAAGNAPADVINRDKLDLKNAQNEEEAAKFSQGLNAINTADELGRITHAAKIRYLQNEHNRLTAIKNKTQQQKDELDQIDQDLKASVASLNGQFNLGDIKVPTVFEVRRAIANASGSSSVNSTTNAVANTTNNISINGADIGKVEALMRQLLGAGTRLAPSTRKA